MNKILKFTLVVLVLIIIIEIAFLINNSVNKRTQLVKPTISPTQTPYIITPTPTLREGLNVLFQKKSDGEGRTIIYESKEYKFPGVGEFSVDPLNPELSKPLIGAFKDWEKIENSQDRYILLENPIEKKDLPKIRVSFEGFPVLVKNAAGSTSLAIENLNENKVENSQKALADLSEEKLNKLIQKDDTVIIFPLLSDAQQIVNDDEKTPFAFWIILRRNEGLKAVGLEF